MTEKDIIIALFRENVKGKSPDISDVNQKHDGKKGHWLEEQFGIARNANNCADLFGYELKNQTTSKTTFGDWSANRYIYTESDYTHLFEGNNKKEKQNSFLKIFGKPNLDKGGRYSWSGEACPNIHFFNSFGQRLVVKSNRDIEVIYNFSNDKRENKREIVPTALQQDGIVLAKWFGTNSPSDKQNDKCLKSKLEDKFNDKGWFTCKTDSIGVYKEICFGNPINFDTWIKLVEDGVVFFDSGMYEGNPRPYSQWRSNNSFWDSLIVERYE